MTALRFPLRALACCLAITTLVACDDADPEAPGFDAAAGAGGGAPALLDDAGAADGATARDDGGAALDGAPVSDPPRGLVVVHSDYQSTSVSLLDRFGTTRLGDCIGTGSVAPKLNVAFSGDVVTASQPQPGHEVVLIDRGKDLITYVSPDDCSVLRQFSVATDAFSNPHDVTPARPGIIYVTRYERSDLLVVESASGRAIGGVALQPFASAAPDGKPVLARPDRAIAVDGRVYVSLNNLAADFKAAGFGRLVVVDPATDTAISSIDLGPLKNCGSIQTVPGERALLVSCGGAFSDGAKQIDHAGLALVNVAATPPTVTVFPSSALGRVVNGFSAVALTPSTVFAVTNGDFMGSTPDQLWKVGGAGAAGQKLLDAGGSFVLGDLALDAERGRLYVTDATTSKPRVHVFDVSNPAMVQPLGQIASGVAKGLPPRYLGWY